MKGEKKRLKYIIVHRTLKRRGHWLQCPVSSVRWALHVYQLHALYQGYLVFVCPSHQLTKTAPAFWGKMSHSSAIVAEVDRLTVGGTVPRGSSWAVLPLPNCSAGCFPYRRIGADAVQYGGQ